jgi:hypothetical protein
MKFIYDLVELSFVMHIDVKALVDIFSSCPPGDLSVDYTPCPLLSF